MLRKLTVPLVVVAAIAAPAATAAQRCVAPPGTAAVDQYCETVPSAGGDRGSSDPSTPAARIPLKTAAALGRSGPDGQALAGVLGHKGKRRSGSGSAGSRQDPAVSPYPVPRAPSNNPLSAVSQAVGKGTTSGPWFAGALIIVTLLMAGWGWTAYRRRSSEPE